MEISINAKIVPVMEMAGVAIAIVVVWVNALSNGSIKRQEAGADMENHIELAREAHDAGGTYFLACCNMLLANGI